MKVIVLITAVVISFALMAYVRQEHYKRKAPPRFYTTVYTSNQVAVAYSDGWHDATRIILDGMNGAYTSTNVGQVVIATCSNYFATKIRPELKYEP